MRPAGAEIIDGGAPRFGERLERQDVGIREVGDVDVIAQAGAVGRRVVVAEDRQVRSAVSGVDRPRNQVDLRIVILAELAAGSAPAALK